MPTVVLAWSVLPNHCIIWHSWQVTSGKVLVGIWYRFSVPVGLEQCVQNAKFNTTILSLLTKGKTGTLMEALSQCCLSEPRTEFQPLTSRSSRGQSTHASELLLLAETPWQLWDWTLLCWAWVTLAEMSAEPALALSAFAVSCKVNQRLLHDDKCYSWESSWGNLSIVLVQNSNTSCGFQGDLSCEATVVFGASNIPVQHQGKLK